MRKSRQMIVTGLYAGIIVIILSAMVAVSYVGAMARMQAEADSAHRSFLRQVVQTVEGRVQAIDLAVVNVGFDLPIRRFMDGHYFDSSERAQNQIALQTQLLTIKNLNPEIQSMWVFSDTQKLVLSDSSMEDIEFFFERDWISAMWRAPEVRRWSGVRHIKPVRSEVEVIVPVISLVRPYPVTSFADERRGVIVANVHPKALQRAIVAAVPEAQTAVVVVDQNGGIVLDTTIGKRDGEAIAALRKTMGSTAFGPWDFTDSGERYTVFADTSTSTGWTFFSFVSRVEAHGPLLALRNVLLAAALALILVGVAAVTAVTRWSHRPINRLIRKVSQASAGQDPDIRRGSGVKDVADVDAFFSSMLREHELMQAQVTQSLPALRWRVVTELFMGANPSIPFDDKVRTLADLGVSLYSGAYCVLLIEIDEYEKVRNELPEQGMTLYSSMVRRKAEQLVIQNDAGTAIELWNARIAVLISFEQSDVSAALLTTLATAEALREFAETSLPFTVTIGIGSVTGRSPPEISKSYRDAQKCLDFKVVTGSNVVTAFEDIALPDEKETSRLYADAENIVGALKAGALATVREHVNGWFEQASAMRIPPDLLRQLVMHFLMMAIGSAKAEETDDFVLPPIPHDTESLEQLRRHVLAVVSDYADARNETRAARRSDQVVSAITEFIYAHYHEPDLSLGRIADTFRVSVSHLSKIFKDVTGSKFLDFLISVRVERAKKLLEENSKVNEVAAMVGYTNTHSFLRIFKKSTGMTPGDYRINTNLQRVSSANND